jgi:hypothetical protein
VLVSITGFGSVWRQRINKDEKEPQRSAHGVYYNTTGIEISGSIRQRPKITGYARFHSCGGFDGNHLGQMIGRVFECAEPCVWQGNNKLLFKRLLRARISPDAFLVVARAELGGRIAVGSNEWRSADTWLMSFSEDGSQQEAMLLMPAHSWIKTELGQMVLRPDSQRPWLGQLVPGSVRREHSAEVKRCDI